MRPLKTFEFETPAVWSDGLNKKVPNIFQKMLNLEPKVKHQKKGEKLYWFDQIWRFIKTKFWKFSFIFKFIFVNDQQFIQIHINLFKKSIKK